MENSSQDKRTRRYKSKKDELLKKSREAMLAAVQIYNNPHITFKSESFITLSVISWTYLLHGYYQKQNIDYRYYKVVNGRKIYSYTKHGAYKHWELEECLKQGHSPIDVATKTNLMFLIGIRHEIEHQMTSSIDEFIGAKLQACVLNYNHYIKALFGNKWSIDKELSLSISIAQIDPLAAKAKSQGMNENVQRFISEFEKDIDDDVAKDKHYAYRILYLPITVNHKGKADRVIEFTKLTEEQVNQIHDIVVFKDREKPKFKPKKIVEMMKKDGFSDFSIHKHTKIWQTLKAAGLDLTQYGVQMSDGAFYWYENWVELVRKYCFDHFAKS